MSEQTLHVGDGLPRDLLDRAITGLRLQGATLGAELGADPTLLLFLRHFG